MGIVTLARMPRENGRRLRVSRCSSHGIPPIHRFSSELAQCSARDQMALNVEGVLDGVVTLSLIDWNLPTTADCDAWDFNGLACRSIVYIGPISLNVTTPSKPNDLGFSQRLNLRVGQRTPNPLERTVIERGHPHHAKCDLRGPHHNDDNGDFRSRQLVELTKADSIKEKDAND
jgi:hypothetical protein